MCPRRRATSQSRSGSVGRSRGPRTAGPAHAGAGRRPRRCAPPRSSRSARWAGSVDSAAARSYAARAATYPPRRCGSGAHQLQGGDHLRVGAVGGGGAVPGLAVRIPGAGQRLGQGPVRPPPVLARSRPGRSPSAPAGDAPRHDAASATSSPESRAASRAASSRPRPAAARRSTSSSPVSSAAASSSSDCTGAGRRRLRSRKACSTRAVRWSCGRQRGGSPRAGPA